jgi:hypothetical protein
MRETYRKKGGGLTEEMEYGAENLEPLGGEHEYRRHCCFRVLVAFAVV